MGKRIYYQISPPISGNAYVFNYIELNTYVLLYKKQKLIAFIVCEIKKISIIILLLLSKQEHYME